MISIEQASNSPRKAFAPQVIALVAFLAIAGGAVWWLRKGGDELPAERGAKVPTQTGSAAVDQSPASQSNETGVVFPLIKRSGAENWEVAGPYYQDGAGAEIVEFSTQIKKGTLCILPGALRIDQVADGMILATHRATREQWILRPDNPQVLDEVAISEGIAFAILAGIYTGPEQIEMTSGAPRRLPSMLVLCVESTVGFLNFEHPAAPLASKADLKRFENSHQERTTRIGTSGGSGRTAEQEAQRAKDIAELEKDPAWNPDATKAPATPPKNNGDQDGDDKAEPVGTGELAGAKADLAELNSRIESERKRHADALNVINTLTLNKTRPVKEGSLAYHRCMEASRIIKEVETGAPELKAEKARLETLVSELEKAE